MKWLADENFDNDILRGIQRRDVGFGFDVVRVQDIAEIAGLEDRAVLGWATTHDRILLTHDLSTMIPAIQEQLARFGSCSPVVLVRHSIPVSLAINDILLLDECSIKTDWVPGIVYLPLG